MLIWKIVERSEALVLYIYIYIYIDFSILVDIMGWFCFSCEKSLTCARVYEVGSRPLGHC